MTSQNLSRVIKTLILLELISVDVSASDPKDLFENADTISATHQYNIDTTLHFAWVGVHPVTHSHYLVPMDRIIPADTKNVDIVSGKAVPESKSHNSQPYQRVPYWGRIDYKVGGIFNLTFTGLQLSTTQADKPTDEQISHYYYLEMQGNFAPQFGIVGHEVASRYKDASKYPGDDAFKSYLDESCILSYQVNAFPADFLGDTDKVKIVQESPETTSSSTSYTSGSNWSISGNIGIFGKEGTGGLAGSYGMSRSTSYTLLDTEIDNHSADNGNNAKWIFNLAKGSKVSTSTIEPHMSVLWTATKDKISAVNGTKTNIFNIKTNLSYAFLIDGESHSGPGVGSDSAKTQGNSSEVGYILPFNFPPDPISSN